MPPEVAAEMKNYTEYFVKGYREILRVEK
jgi:hypothetical protein